MNRREFIRTATTAMAGVFLGTAVKGMGNTSKDSKPNIIVIFTDDHGYADLSCQGVFDDVKTPNIDALAKGGVRMTDGYVTAPQCVPSRGGLMSGQYQNKLGLEKNRDNLGGFNKAMTIPSVLRKPAMRPVWRASGISDRKKKLKIMALTRSSARITTDPAIGI